MENSKQQLVSKYPNSENQINVSIDNFISMLDICRSELAKQFRLIPDCIWNYQINLIREYGTSETDPKKLTSDIYKNSHYVYFDNVRIGDEKDSDLILRVADEYNGIIFEEEKIILFNDF